MVITEDFWYGFQNLGKASILPIHKMHTAEVKLKGKQAMSLSGLCSCNTADVLGGISAWSQFCQNNAALVRDKR